MVDPALCAVMCAAPSIAAGRTASPLQSQTLEHGLSECPRATDEMHQSSVGGLEEEQKYLMPEV